MPVERTLTVGGLKVRYVEAGEGEPVVLVHGLGSALNTWNGNIDALAERSRVVALDLPGHGLSDIPRAPYTVESGAKFLVDFIDAMGMKSASLVGNSMGGLLSLKLALGWPEKVNRLVLVDSAGLGREIAWFLRLESLPLLGELMERPSLRQVKSVIRHLLYDPRHATDELAQELYKYRSRPGAKANLLKNIRRGVNLFGQRREVLLVRDLPTLQTPTLIVWGKQDRIVPVRQAYQAKEAIGRCHLHVCDECGHWPQVEKAAAFNEVVLDFVAPRTARMGHIESSTQPPKDRVR